MSTVLVFLEAKSDEPTRLSLEALAAGVRLAAETGSQLAAAMVGAASASGFAMLGGAAQIYAISHPLLARYTADGFTAAYAQLIAKLQPDFVLFPHSYEVRDFVPRLATRLTRVLLSDVIGFEVASGQVTADKVTFTRQLFQGKLNGHYRAASPAPVLASVQAGAFRADSPSATTATVETFTPELDAATIRTQPGEPFRAAAQTVDLGSAPLIVSVGRGIKDEANIAIVKELADALGAELAASRPICDAGWLPMERQVGSSGQTVAPKMYLAVGISGAIQHLVGMKASQCVIAINKDENAPIFEIADYGIVGDLFEVVPALTAAVRKAKG